MTDERLRHEWDEDACCIHCGFDGAEEWHDRCYNKPAEMRAPMPDFARFCEVRHKEVRKA